MSFQNTDEALDKAFELIETDRLDEARAILKPILETEKDNPDVWWLYAHAVTDPETARLALNNVQRLDPNYLNTGELLYALEHRSVGGSAVESLDKEPSFLPPAPASLPDLPQAGKKLDVEDEWDAFDEDDEDYVPWYRRPAFLLIAGLLLFLLVAALFILNPQQQTPSATQTVATTDSSSVAQIPTMENIAPTAVVPTIEALANTEIPTLESAEGTVVPPTTDSSSIVQAPTLENIAGTAVVPTIEASTSSEIPTLESVGPTIASPTTDSSSIAQIPTSDSISTLVSAATIPGVENTPSGEGNFDNILTALGAFDLPDQAVSVENTNLGNTLVVSVCTEPGAKLRQDLSMAMDAYSTQLNDFPSDLDGAGIRMLDCTSGSTLLFLGVPAQDISAYTSGSMDQNTFEAKWQPIVLTG